MTTTDIGIIIGIILYMLLGFRDGFFKKVFGILGFWGGLILAIKFMSPLSEYLMEWMSFSDDVSLILAFFLIFLFVVVAVNLMYRWFGKSGSENLTVKSRMAGAVLGAAQGLVGISLLLIMLSFFDVPEQADRDSSSLYRNIVKIAPKVFDYSTQWMPESKAFFDVIAEKIERFNPPR
jgi:membrane protein required for colicin V production